jgi:FkbM family methyltransferase
MSPQGLIFKQRTSRLSIHFADAATGRFVMELDGQRFGAERQIVPGPPHVVRARSSAWERLYLDHLKWLLAQYEVNLVIDAGANVGQFGRSLRKAGYTDRIISFEPVPAYAERLVVSTAADPTWVVYPYALGRCNTTACMNVSAGTGSSFLVPNDYGMRSFADLQSWRVREVTMNRLDSVLSDLADVPGSRIFLKMDTQGYDLEVFAGASGLLPRIVALQSEVSLLPIYGGMASMAESLSVYSAAGYFVSGMFPVSVEKMTGRVLEFDCVLVSHDEGYVSFLTLNTDDLPGTAEVAVYQSMQGDDQVSPGSGQAQLLVPP